MMETLLLVLQRNGKMTKIFHFLALFIYLYTRSIHTNTPQVVTLIQHIIHIIHIYIYMYVILKGQSCQ